MAVFAFICKSSGGAWTAKQRGGDLESSAADTTELQKQVRSLALESAGSGSVSIDFSLITPTSGVLLVTVGGGSVGGFAPAAGASAGVAHAAAAAPAAEEEKKVEEKEESDDDMGFSLFD